MGLSGRRVKQRIPADPRNLAWADDAAKFGSNYLSKFGWDASKGLGVDGEGRTSHIKVSHKLDMLGIGAAHQMDPNGIAWKQNKDFENLLKRLNENIQDTTPAVEVNEVGGEEDRSPSDGSGMEKRKRKKDREGKSEEKAKKRRKKDVEGGEEREEATKDVEDAQISQEGAKAEAQTAPAKPFVPRNRAHRARAIASKAIASKSSAHISEILGIAPTPSMSSTASGSGTPNGGKLTPLDDGTTTLEKLTTSAKSVADYFKEKLLAKSSKSGTQTPTTPLVDFKQELEDSHDAPRGGLGASRMGLGIKAESLDTESQRIGLSKFSSLMSSAFLSATTTLVSDPSTEDPTPSGSDSSSCVKRENGETESVDDTKDGLARETKRREKKEKKRRRDAGESIEGSGHSSDNDSSQKGKGKEKKRRREVGAVAEDQADKHDSEVDRKSKKAKDTKGLVDVQEVTLSKEERRRLRKEKKACKESSL
ncbi:hypothetical protein C0991_007236 [Blastosporella zonata]|nr:hypothetical protein C0991_007236 [Blastosporella zonata]